MVCCRGSSPPHPLVPLLLQLGLGLEQSLHHQHHQFNRRQLLLHNHLGRSRLMHQQPLMATTTSSWLATAALFSANRRSICWTSIFQSKAYIGTFTDNHLASSTQPSVPYLVPQLEDELSSRGGEVLWQVEPV